MVNECPIKIGFLVSDVNPYKAPELFFGLGIVTEVHGGDHVSVYWVAYGIYETLNIGFLEVIDEGG